MASPFGYLKSIIRWKRQRLYGGRRFLVRRGFLVRRNVMSNSDWLIPRKLQEQIERDQDKMFLYGYALGSLVAWGIALGIHLWGMW